MSEAFQVSIVIPIYNEQGILRSSVVDLFDRLRERPQRFEVILAENGSTDGTLNVASELAERFDSLSVVSVPEPNYGKALKAGILAARGKYVVSDEIDICDTAFYSRALDVLESGQAEIVVGSKLAGGARDERPLFRHAASLVYTKLLKALLGFQGTDTHGPKAFMRAALLETVEACQVERDVFASELVIRAHRAGVRVVEVPISVVEKRPPSINLLRRTPHVLKNLIELTWSIRFRR